ncbi:glycosyltransferase [Bacteroides fragilis]|uniref:glycosyltransferase family 2 protein n=1 Tax=Bacteroides fragilis TaxID=817 RepID=UPI00187AC5EF|nr:glycosyltransferase [Bacteroides fragilis]MBE7400178.1 glycosyltransferase [Bacteroides fragilis]
MKISIIMPVYNAEQNLHRAVNSIIAQTLADWELLLIDDGSTDASPVICDDYARHDPRIRIFHKKNEGVAMARQIGINNALGKYSIHADADDWTEPTMLEEMYNKAWKENADIVIADYFINNSYELEHGYIRTQRPTSAHSIQVLTDIFENKLFGALWNKLLKTELYKKYNARFFSGINYCEDVLIWAQILKHKEVKVHYLNRPFYHYYINPDSITHNITRNSYETRKEFYKKLETILPSDEFKRIRRSVRLGILAEGFMNNVVTNKEAWKELITYNMRAALCETKSIRWRIGYVCLAIGIFPIAKRILRY